MGMCAWFMRTDGIVSFITKRIKWACAMTWGTITSKRQRTPNVMSGHLVKMHPAESAFFSSDGPSTEVCIPRGCAARSCLQNRIPVVALPTSRQRGPLATNVTHRSTITREAYGPIIAVATLPGIFVVHRVVVTRVNIKIRVKADVATPGDHQ